MNFPDPSKPRRRFFALIALEADSLVELGEAFDDIVARFQVDGPTTAIMGGRTRSAVTQVEEDPAQTQEAYFREVAAWAAAKRREAAACLRRRVVGAPHRDPPDRPVPPPVVIREGPAGSETTPAEGDAIALAGAYALIPIDGRNWRDMMAAELQGQKPIGLLCSAVRDGCTFPDCRCAASGTEVVTPGP